MFIKFFSLLVLGGGVFVLVQLAAPFVAFKMWEVTAYNSSEILVDPSVQKGEVAGVKIERIGDFPAFISSNTHSLLPYKEFNLSVPSLKINQERTLVESNDFEKTLAHLPGTALPGERGNVFITGHSSLPFFKPGDKKPIFANLPNIKKGDSIILEALGQRFTYIVEGMKIVEPEDVGVVMAPDTTGRYLSLMTCVPPGFNTKRLVVLAKLK